MASHLDIANILCNRLRNKWNWIDSATLTMHDWWTRRNAT